MSLATLAVAVAALVLSLHTRTCVAVAWPFAGRDLGARVPRKVCDVRSYGAVGDGNTDNTDAIRKALADCGAGSSSAAPAQVLVTQGSYVTGALNLSSYVDLHISNATLVALDGTEDPVKWPVVPALPGYGTCRDGGFPSDHKGVRHQAFISGWHTVGASVTGSDGATLDGKGAWWWARFKAGKLDYGRPRLVEPMFCQDFALTGLTVKDSPFWTIHPYACKGVHIADLTITAPNTGNQQAPNTDGIDPDSTTEVLIERVNIDVGDDAIAIKSGIDYAGRQFAHPTANMTIRDSTFVSRHVSIGSEMSGGVYNVTVRDCVYGPSQAAANGDPSDIGIYLKTERGRGGLVSDITFLNSTVLHGSTSQPIKLSMDYGGGSAGNASSTPHYRNIMIDGMVGVPSPGMMPGIIEGLSESPIENITLRNIYFPQLKTTDWQCDHAHGQQVNVTPPCLCLKPPQPA